MMNRPLTATKPIFYFDKPDVHSRADLRQSDFHLAPSFRIINLCCLGLAIYNADTQDGTCQVNIPNLIN